MLFRSIDTLKGSVIANGTYVGVGTSIIKKTVTLSGSGSIKFGSVVILDTLVDGGKSISVRGSWTNSGIFTTSGTTQFDSTLSQTINSSPFNNLTINKSNGTVTSGGNIIVSNDFNLSSGTFQANSITLTVGRHFTNSGTFTSEIGRAHV